MTNNQRNQNSEKRYKKSKFRESCREIGAFVIFCNPGGKIPEELL